MRRQITAGVIVAIIALTAIAGDALSFHTLDGSKFTVAYTVDAVAKSLNQ
jgi:hypothetical protein